MIISAKSMDSGQPVFFVCVAVAVHFTASMHLYVGMYIHARSRVICVSIQT